MFNFFFNVQNFSGTTSRRRGVSLPSFEILRRNFMVYKSIDQRFGFYNNVEKVRPELALFSVEKVRALHMTSFLLSVLLQAIARSQSAHRNFDIYCKIKTEQIQIV